MNFLQYKSDEMYSSTQLIRQSKMIFDKLNKEEIEKAVILRDGKPSFLLMDFKQYEAIMEEYMEMKKKQAKKPNSTNKTLAKEQNMQEDNIQKEYTKPVQEKSTQENLTPQEEKELNEALAKLDNLDMGTNSVQNSEMSKEELKEFWD